MPLCGITETLSDVGSVRVVHETKAIFREGLQQGREQGFESGKVIARFEDGMSIEEIAEKTKVSIETVKSILTKEGLI